MKRTHRADLRCWSRFDEARDLDFNGWAWLRADGSVLIDPPPLGDHDRKELEAAGPLAWIVITNSDHVRSATDLVNRYGAKVAGPRGEKDRLGIACDRWLADGDEIVPGLIALEMAGSKTPGELALLLERRTLITGDLVRAPIGGTLRILPDDKLSDRKAAIESLRRLGDLDVDAVLVGDGWPLFRDGRDRLRDLIASLS